MNNRLNKLKITRLWVIQLTTLIALGLLDGLLYSVDVAYSILLGGIVAIIPNAYFAYKLFKYQGARAARQIVSGFYKGEAIKIVLSIFLFTLVFRYCNIKPLAFFMSYILIIMMHWLTPWVIVNKQKRPKSD